MGLSWVTVVGVWCKAVPSPGPHRRPWNRRVLTVVRLGLDRADAQVLAEERHGRVLALATLAGHGAAQGELGAKRVATYPSQPLRPRGLHLLTPLPQGVSPHVPQGEDPLFSEPPFCFRRCASRFQHISVLNPPKSPGKFVPLHTCLLYRQRRRLRLRDSETARQ